jgi:Na+/H+ antiporter NhaD/arsenite permease-like protein
VIAVAVFVTCYVGLFLGRLPGLRVDRTGIALLGAIALVASGTVSEAQAVQAVDVPTVVLLFALMVVSAQLRVGGFYTRVARRLAAVEAGPAVLLGLVVVTMGGLAAVFSNDIVCLAAAPVLIEACRHRGLRPLPFLLGLACAANVGSAMTVIGNPQNMLIGQTLHLSFGGYLRAAWLPATLGLLATWGVIAWQFRHRWHDGETDGGGQPLPVPPPFNRWESGKGLAVAVALLAAFLLAPWPRELCALAGAALILTSRRRGSRDMLGLVDWQLLVLFIGLFVINDAFQATGWPARLVAAAAARGIDLAHPVGLFAGVVVLSNAVSNVPAVMLFLPLATHPQAGPLLAIGSTLAGNLFLVGSIANLIVADLARRHGVALDWRSHARTGVPVTLVTLAVAATVLACE